MDRKSIFRLQNSFIAYLLAVIIFGAYVRASGSGAGCGSHWPLCNGELVPREPQIKTLVEFTHRVSSGLALPFALLIYYIMRKSKAATPLAKKAMAWSIFFLITEGLLGAGLVRLEHVAENKSAFRGLSMGLHLVNTFILMAFASITSFAQSRFYQHICEKSLPTLSKKPTELLSLTQKETKLYFQSGVAILLLVGISGAITALGDTLFPVQSLDEAWTRGMSPAEHIFIQLRIYHPFIAVAGALITLFFSIKLSSLSPEVKTVSSVFNILILFQLLVGYANVQLLAPTWLQLSHLMMAELIWIGFIVLGVSALKICESMQCERQQDEGTLSESVSTNQDILV